MFAAIALATGGEQPNRHDLAQCLAYLAHAPEYRSLSDDDLEASEPFLDAAKGHYCSDEVSPFWDVAHSRARAKLGIPAGSSGGIEQQDVAEQEMRSILVDAWKEARRSRSQPEPLSHDKMLKFVLAWLLDEQNSAVLGSAVDKPVLCAVAAIKKSNSLRVEEIAAGLTSPAFRKIGIGCGYDTAHQILVGKVSERFPEMDANFAGAIVIFLMGQFTFWGLTGQ